MFSLQLQQVLEGVIRDRLGNSVHIGRTVMSIIEGSFVFSWALGYLHEHLPLPLSPTPLPLSLPLPHTPAPALLDNAMAAAPYNAQIILMAIILLSICRARFI